MKKVILYEPSIASNNIGDEIIVDGVKKALNFFLDDAFVIEMATHTPISNRYMYFLGKPDYSFVCGSNLIVGKLNSVIHLKQWMLSFMTLHNFTSNVMIGVGAQQYGQKFNNYTKSAYRKIFNHNFVHSVRDSYTEKALRAIGINNVINTSCPTMWFLTPEHCVKIPKSKAESVVFTLTDYKQNSKRDEFIVKTLKEKYKNVSFWVQGFGDYDYFKSLNGIKDINIIAPNLRAYDQYLNDTDTDFVGTRLHGGMRALQHKKRTIIIGIDNRSFELKQDFQLPVLTDNRIEELSEMIDSQFETTISLPTKNIQMFLTQFKSEEV